MRGCVSCLLYILTDQFPELLCASVGVDSWHIGFNFGLHETVA